MYKKILLTLLLTISFANATTYELTYRLGANLVDKAENGNRGIAITYEDGEDSTQDWVAVYKKEDSNEWENVISWSWVDDLEGLAPADSSHYFINENLEDGEYEFRFFKHNSYDVEHAESFTVTAQDKESHLSIVSRNDIWLILSSSYVGDDTWIGIYKKEDSNDWNNVIDWEWIKKDETWLRQSGYENGTYEARLFYHNSYDVEKRVEFTIEGNEENNNFINILSQNPQEIKIKHGENVTKMSWIAIFEQGAESKAENVLVWKYLSDYMCCPNYNYSATLNISDLGRGNYDIRLFSNNSYNLETQTTFEITDENLQNKQVFKRAHAANVMGNRDVQIEHIVFTKKDGDWVGMFEVGAEYNIDNLIAWSYIEDYRTFTNLKIIKHLQLNDEQTYQYVYFNNDSYNVLKEEQLTLEVDQGFPQF